MCADCCIEACEYVLVDVERIRCLDLASNSHGTAPGEGTGSDQINHESEAESRRHAVAFAKPPERTVVCDARPTLLVTGDQAEAIIFENLDLRLAIVNEYICVGEKHGPDHRRLPHPLTRLPPHLLPGQPQNLGGTPE